MDGRGRCWTDFVAQRWEYWSEIDARAQMELLINILQFMSNKHSWVVYLSVSRLDILMIIVLPQSGGDLDRTFLLKIKIPPDPLQ